MKVKDITTALEEFAPLGLQDGFDNSGLLVGRPDDGVKCALVCVDVTEGVMDEAAEVGADMIVAHHPVIFNPLRGLTGADRVQRVVERAVRGRVAIYACHTNLDAVRGGLSFRLAEMLGVENPQVLSPRADGNGYGIIGSLRQPVATEEFLEHVRKVLNIKALRYSDPCTETVKKIALCSGSGAGEIESAVAAGADIFMCADLKYNNFVDAAGRLTIADIGHLESEYCAIDLIYEIITKKFPTFALRRSTAPNPVNYLVR